MQRMSAIIMNAPLTAELIVTLHAQPRSVIQIIRVVLAIMRKMLTTAAESVMYWRKAKKGDYGYERRKMLLHV